MDELDSLQEILGVSFNDVTHLRQSLIHRSYLNENPGFTLPSNERLEFLGDAILGFVIANTFYGMFPDFNEGDLTRLRSAVVRTETLARVASSINLGSYLYLGKGENDSGGRTRQRNLACALEAVIGAVLVDQGVKASGDFILTILKREVSNAAQEALRQDSKSKLQEYVQSGQASPPTYRVVDTAGPDHDRIFTVQVFAEDNLIGEGEGKSKRAAEQEAAKAALERYNREENFAEHIQKNQAKPNSHS